MKNAILTTLASLAAIVGLVFASGCASFSGAVKQHQSTVELVAQVATMKFIQDKPKAEQAARAAKVRVVVAALKKLVSEETVTLQRVAQLALTYTDQLQPEDKVLALAFIKALQDELSQSVGVGELDSDSVVALKGVFDSIDFTAALFGG